MRLAAAYRMFRSAILITLVGTLSGCGGGASDMPELGQVQGTVKLGGSALEGATVTFQPTSGRPSSGVTDAEGHYELVYTRDEMGAKIGKHKVMISTYREARPDAEDAANQKAKPETVPAKYNAETTLEEEVKAGDNTIDFELDATGKIVGPDGEEAGGSGGSSGVVGC